MSYTVRHKGLLPRPRTPGHRTSIPAARGRRELLKIRYDQAQDEIAAKMREVIARDGGEAAGGYCGSGAGYNAGTLVLMDNFLDALGSPDIFWRPPSISRPEW